MIRYNSSQVQPKSKLHEALICIGARKFKFTFLLVLFIPINIHSYPTIYGNTSGVIDNSHRPIFLPPKRHNRIY